MSRTPASVSAAFRALRAKPDAADEGIGIRALVVPLIRDHRGSMVRIGGLSLLGGLAEAAILVVLARVAFALTSTHKLVAIHFLGLVDAHLSVGALLGIAAFLTVVRLVLQALQSVASAKLAIRVNTDVRKTLVREYLAASWTLHSNERDGALQLLLTSYAGSASAAVFGVSQLAMSTLNLAVLLGSALIVNPLAAAGVLIGALLVGALLGPFRSLLRRQSARAAEANLTFATGITELASTLQEVRVFDVEREVSRRADDLIDRSARLQLRTAMTSGVIPAVYQGAALLLVIGALSVAYATSATRLASLGAVVLIMLRALTYAQSVQGSIQGLNETAPYLEKLRSEQRRYVDAAVPRSGQPVGHIGTVTFDGVGFEYRLGQPVLSDVSFEIPSGEIVGIVGPSGAGKSTLVQLMLRLRDPTHGRILVDDRDARTLALGSWYERVTFVPQDARLVSGTIADNIRFFRDDLTDAMIEQAARLAHLHDDIVSWPAGYDTNIGERGNQLSGGQRQRLSIARALAEQPDLVVLDEPTSALDVKSEALMRTTMAELAPHKTVIVIAHRISTLSICDRIMVVSAGRLQGFDTPDRLATENRFYQEALQLSGLR